MVIGHYTPSSLILHPFLSSQNSKIEYPPAWYHVMNRGRPGNGVIQALIQSPLVHFDETSLFENKQRHWLHSASSKQMTFYFIHNKRGKAGMDVEANSIASGNATTTSTKKHSSSILQNLKKRNEDAPNRRKQKIYSIV